MRLARMLPGRGESNPPFRVNDALEYELQDVRERLSDAAEMSELDQLFPSYWASVRYHYHEFRTRNATKFIDPTRLLYRKNDAADFARQNGIRVPAILGKWSRPEEIEWETLPNAFVVKSTIGGGGINVFPVTRVGSSFYDGISGETLTSQEIVERLLTKHNANASYFAEEYLPGPADGSSRVPLDVKVFCFYGKVAYVEIRSDDGTRSQNRQTVRIFKPDGTELVGVRPLMKHGPDLQIPRHFGEIVKASEKLSAAIRRPCVRLDFFDTDQGIYFGEVSDLPGRLPLLRADLDLTLGEEYEDAMARLYADLAAEGCLGISYGDQSSVPRPRGEFSPATQDHPHPA